MTISHHPHDSAGIGENGGEAALACIAVINPHIPLNDGEKRLLFTIENEIRLAFRLEGSTKPGLLVVDASDAPEEWIW